MFRSLRFHPLIAVAAFAISGSLFTATAIDAFAGAPSFRLITAQPVAGNRNVVIRDTIWACTGGTCVANSVTSRAELVCSAAAKKIGKLSAFTANGVAFDDAQLTKCNAKAK